MQRKVVAWPPHLRRTAEWSLSREPFAFAIIMILLFVQRKVPKNIVAGLRPGLNTIKITMDDEYLSGYAFGLVLPVHIQPHPAQFGSYNAKW